MGSDRNGKNQNCRRHGNDNREANPTPHGLDLFGRGATPIRITPGPARNSAEHAGG